MSESLEDALASVREHFRGKAVNPNTVLAAYMRAAGINPTGPKWQQAKAAHKAGAAFAEAVASVGGDPSHSEPKTLDLPTILEKHDGPTRKGSRSQASSVRTHSPARPDSRPVSTPLRASADRPNNRISGANLGSSEEMSWFPKRFAPGDIHGEGAGKLLGRPNLETMEVLVRETAQNSWDARGKADQIDFCINLRKLSAENMATLRNTVFPQTGGGLGISELLNQDEVWGLEISDRGTIGLGGPIRNDLVPNPGEPTNFIDFVFDLGAPKTTDMTGGTYGYGKTVSYSTSSVGTVLIWSRCRSQDEIEDRLIGSAIGPSFNMGIHRYTGRHWWGRNASGSERIEPLLGEQASNIAQKIFSRGFEKSDTGTSILILAPDFGDDLTSRSDQAAALAEAVQNHLWPKLISSTLVDSEMAINVQIDGEPVLIGDHHSNRIRSSYASCLNAVREVQASGDGSNAGSPSAISINRYNDTIGHLSLTRFALDTRSSLHDKAGEPEERRLKDSRVALMRNEAELVVKYLEFPALTIEGFAWVGVFKPVTATDRAFAAAEPPAHDEWNPAMVPDKIQKSIVNVALRKIREEVNLHLAPAKPLAEASSQPPAAQIGDFLSGLLVGLEGPAPSIKKNPGSRPNAKKAKPKAEIIDVRTDPLPVEGWNTSIVTVQLRTPGVVSVPVSMDLSIGIEGNSRDSADDIVLKNYGWLSTGGSISDSAIELKDGESAFYVFDSNTKVAIDIQPRVVMH